MFLFGWYLGGDGFKVVVGGVCVFLVDGGEFGVGGDIGFVCGIVGFGGVGEFGFGGVYVVVVVGVVGLIFVVDFLDGGELGIGE